MMMDQLKIYSQKLILKYPIAKIFADQRKKKGYLQFLTKVELFPILSLRYLYYSNILSKRADR